MQNFLSVLRGTFAGHPPDLLQSILQAVTGQMMGNLQNNTQPTSTQAQSTTTATTTTTTGTRTEASTGTSPASAAGTNVNSQARGNTQTHPTTATQTRSTPRPHVHLAQHTMQGFDPFLPCNSHHIRRRHQGQPAATNNAATGTNTDAEAQNNNQPNNPFYNVLQGFLRTVGNHVNRMQRGERPAQQENTNANTTAQPPTNNTSSQPIPDPLPPFSTFLAQNLVRT